MFSTLPSFYRNLTSLWWRQKVSYFQEKKRIDIFLSPGGALVVVEMRPELFYVTFPIFHAMCRTHCREKTCFSLDLEEPEIKSNFLFLRVFSVWGKTSNGNFISISIDKLLASNILPELFSYGTVRSRCLFC